MFDVIRSLGGCYAYIPEGNARRSSIRVPIVRDRPFARMLLDSCGLAGHADDDQRRARRGALARLTGPTD